MRETGAFQQAIKHLEKILPKASEFEDWMWISLELSQIWLELGESDKALTILKQAQDQLENKASGPPLLTLNRQVSLYTSIAYRKTGDLTSASKLCQSLISTQPVDAITIQSYQNLGDIKFLEGKFKEAIVIFEKVLKLDPNFKHLVAYDVFYSLGKSYIQLKQVSDSILYLEKAIKTFESGRGQTKIGPIYITLAEILRQIPGSENEAVNYYRQLIALLEPQIPQRKGFLSLSGRKSMVSSDVRDSLLIAYYRIGEFFLVKNEYQEAIDYFIKAVNTGSQNQGHLVASYQLLGTSYLRNGNNQKARNAYKTLLKIDPEHQWSSASWMYRDFGKTYYNQGKYKKAIEYLLRALDLEKIKPSESLLDIHEGLGYSYFFLGNFDMAAEHYRVYLETSEFATPKRKTVIEFLMRATTVSPYFPGSEKLHKAMAHLESGLAFLEKEHLSEARIEFEQTIALDPANSSALYGLGRYYYELDDKEQAFFWLNKSLEKQPNYAPANYYLGRIYYDDKHDFQEALVSFKKALETNLDEAQVADIHLALTTCYHKLGQIG